MKLVSACLVGIKCNYMGGCFESHPKIRELFEKGELFPVCPEVFGGLPVPRIHAEIQAGDGEDVLEGRARVLREDGEGVTDAFIEGANKVLDLAKALNAKEAILKFISPSCGCGTILDGTFSNPLEEREQPKYFRIGDGVTTALLKRNGIKIITEKDL